MASRDDEEPIESAEDTIREQARRVRQSRPDSTADSFRVEVEESATSMRRRVRGPSAWDKAKQKAGAALLTFVVGALGTGGGVAFQATRPPPAVVEVRQLRQQVQALKEKLDEAEATRKEDRKTDNDERKDAVKDLRSLMFEQLNPLTTRVNQLEGWQSEQRRRGR